MQETQLVIVIQQIVHVSSYSLPSVYIRLTIQIHSYYTFTVFHLAAAATVYQVLGPRYICHLVVVNLAHPRARHGLREFSKTSGFFRGVGPKTQAHGAAERPAGPYQVSQRLPQQQQRDALNEKKITQNWPQKIGIQPMPWVTWPRFYPPETAGNFVPCLHLARVRKLTARIARLKRWKSLSAVKPLYTSTAQSHCACCACRMKEPWSPPGNVSKHLHFLCRFRMVSDLSSFISNTTCTF